MLIPILENNYARILRYRSKHTKLDFWKLKINIMSTTKIRARKYTRMVTIVQDRIDATFAEILQRQINVNPSWLYNIYNEFTLVKENMEMRVKEKFQRLLNIVKALFCATILNIDKQAALAINRKIPA